ncbi:MAG: hypothetical protein H0T62_10065 [Parachlamydiaceae bacterium]|nr:hypothetical protein [Parachlamydiaceae bacterium]
MNRINIEPLREMPANYISNMPVEISTIIFFTYLNEKTRLQCGTLDKKIHDFIFSSQLHVLKILPSGDVASHVQVMNYCKLHCDYFCKKLPITFSNFKNFNSIIEAKSLIDERLMKPYDPSDLMYLRIPLLKETFGRLLQQIDPVKNPSLAKGIRPLLDINFNPNPLSDINKEIHFLLRAGARSISHHPDVLGSIIKQNWCTLETVQLLLDFQFEITMGTVISAGKSQQFESILPTLLKLVKTDRNSLSQLCMETLPKYKCLIEESFATKVYAVSSKDLLSILMNNYSERFMTKMVEKCKEELKRKHVELALQNNYSKDLIFKILDNCSEDLGECQIRLAIEQPYSYELIMQLMPKVVNQEQLIASIETLIKRGFDETIIEPHLLRIEGTFNSRMLNYLIVSDYSQGFIQRIISMTVKVESL